MLISNVVPFFANAARTVTRCIALSLLLTALAAPSYAQGNGKDKGKGNDPASNSVPEMDPTSLVSAMSLLSGSVLLLASRRKRE
jgi:hypothetical protein